VLGLVLALATAITVQLVAVLSLTVLAHVTSWRSTAVFTLLFDLGGLVAWAIAGGVAFEVSRARTGVAAAALLPPLLAVVPLLATVVGRRQGLHLSTVVVFPYALVTAAATYTGGRFWERHVRRAQVPA